jgi:hypothetical protein
VTLRGPTSDPTAEEVAAAVAAIEVLWAASTAPEPAVAPEPPRWRFAGRWWTKPVPARRERPS